MKASVIVRSMLGPLALVVMLLSMPAAHAGDAASCHGPSWSPAPMPGFAIDSCASTAWVSTAYTLPTGSKTLEGARGTVEYALQDQGRNPTAVQATDFPIAAGKAAGATPLVPNTTEENRGKNRRVELKKNDCKG